MSFGGGGAVTVFGASGAGNFLTSFNCNFYVLFFATSLTLAVFAKNKQVDAYSLKSAQTTTSAPVTSPETSSNVPKTTQ